MIDIDKITRIAKERNFTKLSISSFPTWIDEHRQEGFEARAGAIRSFWMINGEKNYVEPSGEHMKNTLILFDEKVNENATEEPNFKNKEPKTESTKEIQTTQETLLPLFLTAGLMKKWAGVSTVERMLMFQKTPADQIYERPVGNGQSASYVKGNYMIKEANAAFLFDWRFIHQGLSIGSDGVCVYGYIEANVDGKVYSRPAVGYEEINKKMTAQLAIKSATTDAIKKGLSMFGFNSDVYGGEV